MSRAKSPPKPKPNDPGELALRFVANLTHTGDFSGQPFAPRPWQAAIVRKLFGTIRPDGLRQYRKAFLALPRKQGKTELAAAILLYLLLGTGRRGQQIYSASGDRAQAALIFRAAAAMVRNDPELSKLCLVYDGYKRIICEPLDSFYEALSSDAPRKHGLGPSAVLFDEVHVLPNRDLHEVLTTGFGARREPLTLYITTAGWDRHSLCYELWKYAEHVRDGVIDDPTFLPILYGATEGDDWQDEATWRKAMPALDDFCSLEFIRSECRRAIELPSHENSFKQLYLNLWTEQAVRWLSLDRWNASGDSGGAIHERLLWGRTAYGGLDLSQTRDLTSFVLAFPDDSGQSVKVLCRFWAPEEGHWRQEPRNKDLYSLWARQGFLTLTPGEVIDYSYVENEVLELSRKFDLRKIFADRAMALHLCLNLRDTHGLDVEFLPQVAMSLNGPIREVERLVLAGDLHHGNHPVLAWNAANATVRENATGLLVLDKGKSTGRIDGLAALVNAVAALSADPSSGESVYESRGILLI